MCCFVIQIQSVNQCQYQAEHFKKEKYTLKYNLHYYNTTLYPVVFFLKFFL